MVFIIIIIIIIIINIIGWLVGWLVAATRLVVLQVVVDASCVPVHLPPPFIEEDEVFSYSTYDLICLSSSIACPS
jgi:hypothetical protein